MEKIKLKVFGEYISYIYIITAFLNSKLNMKISYLLAVMGIIQILFFKEKIKTNKKVYGLFSILFLLGIISNFLVSQNDGVGVFIKENSKFFYAVFLFVFLTGKEKINKINYSVNIGILLLCFGIFKEISWFLNGSYARQRGILILGIVYLIIKCFEEIAEKNYKEISFISLPIALYSIVKLNSRMAVFVILLCVVFYGLYCVIIEKKYKKAGNMILIIFFSGLLTYKLLPQEFINRMKTSFHTTNNVSNEDRIVMWKAGYYIFLENPILGVGTSSKDIQPLLIEYADKNVEKGYLRNEFIRDKKFSRLHSMYVDFFVQNGMIGFLYIFLLFILIPYEFLKNKNNKIGLSAFFSIIGFYIYGITWSIWSDYGSIQVVFQIMLALMLINLENEK